MIIVPLLQTFSTAFVLAQYDFHVNMCLGLNMNNDPRLLCISSPVLVFDRHTYNKLVV